MQAKPPKIIVTQRGIADTVKTGVGAWVGKVEQELVLRKQDYVEGDRERMSNLSSRMLFFIPATSYYPSLNRYNDGGVFRRVVPMLPVRGRRQCR